MISSLVFLFIGGAFVLYLFKGIFSLISYDFGPQGLNGKAIFSIFKIPLICFVLLMIFVIWGIPMLEANGLK